MQVLSSIFKDDRPTQLTLPNQLDIAFDATARDYK